MPLQSHPASAYQALRRCWRAASARRIQQCLADMGGIAMGDAPDDFGKVTAHKTKNWAKAVKFFGARIE